MLIALELPNEIALFNTITRGHNMKYRTPFCRVDIYKNSFYPVTIRLWNTLPEDIIYSNSLRQFCTSVNFYLTNQSNLPIISCLDTYIIIITIAFILFLEFCNYYNIIIICQLQAVLCLVYYNCDRICKKGSYTRIQIYDFKDV